ncbi:HNH endonuclease domain-containing protein [Lederbergia panacisoli]|uniref:HNH endonuclease domain-containing protein n=1 Tax=Lederbergia panacisoli TaxID=1255251 RepID=UPI00214B29E3|nr:HNH endonuclease domain-containing protein [Lederbergia panacisoli]MCR2823315.1 HNH endonuclease [Lederbergia panacisoli]
MSHKLKVGELKEQYMTDEEIWRVFTVVLSSKSVKSSTYKYVLMKSIIENLYQINDQYELTYNQLAYSFAKIYWNLVVHHNLVKQNRGPKNARAVTVIQEFQQKHAIPSEFSFDKIQETLQLKLVSFMKSVMKENVFGALYGDTRGQFYAFDHKLEVFRLHPVVHQFMLRYQRLLVNLVNYHMAVMIEELNENMNINFLLNKVESIAKRGSLKRFETILLSHFENKCFYCGKRLSERMGNIHVDHFIPWSFVQSDQIWNLVLACRTCNLSKSDKVPQRPFLDIIIDRNEQLYHMPTESTVLMENYKDKKVILLYDYSIENGFDTLWAPR